MNIIGEYWEVSRILSRNIIGAIVLFCVLLSIIFKKKILGAKPRPIHIYFAGKKVKFYVRDSTDIIMLRGILVEGQLETTPLRPNIIADLGAHIGCASLYYVLLYPHAKILAYEAEPDNFEVLKMNMQQFPQVQCFHRAVASTSGKVKLWRSSSSAGNSITRSESSVEEITVPGITFDEIMLSNPDFVKCDIEGAEYEVFANSKKSSVCATYLIELHSDRNNKSTSDFLSLFPNYQNKILYQTRKRAMILLTANQKSM